METLKQHGTEDPALLIDASIFIFRSYFSLPDNWFSEDGYPTAAVYGYTTFLLNLLENQQASTVAACYDESLDTCFRNDLYPDYKSSRELPDEALAFQLSACKQIGEQMGIASFASDHYEADDLLGTLAQLCRKESRPVALLTRDKDLGQLLKREQDFLWNPSFKGAYKASEGRLYTADIIEKFGVRPDQLVDYLALVGDSVDDIPGVPGVGPKTAAGLLEQYTDILDIFRHLDDLHALPIRGAGKLAEKLTQHTKQIAMARQLATIVEDIPLGIEIEDLALKTVNLVALEELMSSLGFGKKMCERARRILGPES